MATIINSANDLQDMNLDLTADYELGSNIDCTATAGWNGGLGFDPIGTYTLGVPADAFSGNFDGKGYTIKNLTINRPLEDYVGLFGYTILPGGYGDTAKDMKNVILVNASITGGRINIGGLVGFHDHARTIKDISISGAITGNGANVVVLGGLAGYCDGEVSGCSYSGTITINGTGRARQNGGLIGLYRGVLGTDICSRYISMWHFFTIVVKYSRVGLIYLSNRMKPSFTSNEVIYAVPFFTRLTRRFDY